MIFVVIFVKDSTRGEIKELFRDYITFRCVIEMAMIDKSNIMDLTGRPRRILQSPGKNYDGEGERNLTLRGIFDVLSAYRDYEGGINCSKCGKLYKSKVCFIKHLWEHSVYWDLFPGDKNHERVLAIQAALILYSRYEGVKQEDAERLRDLLVTSPTGHDTALTQNTPKKSKPAHQPKSPTLPSREEKIQELSTPKKQILAPWREVLGNRQIPHDTVGPQHLSPVTRPTPHPVSPQLLSPVTPEKNFELNLVCPATPRKDKRKLAAAKLQRTSKKRRRLLME